MITVRNGNDPVKRESRLKSNLIKKKEKETNVPRRMMKELKKYKRGQQNRNRKNIRIDNI